VDHVVLERARVAQRWRGHWDSLRLLTPNWQTRLPGMAYDGPDRDAFMPKRDVVRFLEHYARETAAPVSEYTSVRGVRQLGRGRFWVATNRGDWLCRSVVIATGNCGKAFVPAVSSNISRNVRQLNLDDYRKPEDLESGGVLIVGASASGVQLAREIHVSGRPVLLSVGRHTRMPRRYRGRDIMYWMDAAGISSERTDQVRDLAASRRTPSLQLVGSEDGRSLDLGSLARLGVRLVGRARDADDHELHFAPDLKRHVRLADAKLQRLLDRIDRHIAKNEAAVVPDREPIPDIDVRPGPSSINLKHENIRTVLWATGYSRSYPWLNLGVLDARGELVHHRGITAVPGVYALGLNFMRRRNSSFIDGVGRDAEDLSRVLLAGLRGSVSRTTSSETGAARLVA
jgi:putative flavoprotein involved in K+ transport